MTTLITPIEWIRSSMFDQMILVAELWRDTQEKQYEDQFELLIQNFQTSSGISREKAVDLIVTELGG